MIINLLNNTIALMFMHKLLLLISFICLTSCYRFKEDNELAIPPIARDEIKITNNNDGIKE